MAQTTDAMAQTIVLWMWQEAFDKFGFEDGDGWNGTPLVAEYLEELGFDVHTDTWGSHNYMIFDVKKNGESIIPKDTDVGYAEPETYLPADVVEKLNEKFNGKKFNFYN